jgi:hypothetical protein
LADAMVSVWQELDLPLARDCQPDKLRAQAGDRGRR